MVRDILPLRLNESVRKSNLTSKRLLRLAGIAAAAIAISVGVFNSPSIRAQVLNPGSNPPRQAFEVASIKPVPVVGRTGPVYFGPARVYSTNSVTAYRMILEAYHLEAYQFIGGPRWLDSDRFALDARAQSPVSKDQLRGMLRDLLNQRFQLHVHHETRVVPVYFLMAGKSGPKLREWKEGASLPSLDPSNSHGLGTVKPQTMEEFADFLNGPGFGIDRPVVDKTDLQGVYVVTLPWISPDNDIRTSLGDLGLRLEPRKAPSILWFSTRSKNPQRIESKRFDRESVRLPPEVRQPVKTLVTVR